MLFLPDGKYLYVGDDPYLASLANVLVVDVATSRIVKQIPTCRDPKPMAATPDGRFVYVLNWAADYVLAIRTQDNVAADTIMLSDPECAAASPNGSCLYVGAEKIYVIQPPDHVMIDSISVGSSVCALAVSPDGSRLYACAGGDSGRIYAISIPSDAVEDSTTVAHGVNDICVLQGGRFLYASSPADSSVWVIRTSDDSVVERIPVGFQPLRLSEHPDGSRVYVFGYWRKEFVVLGI